MDQTLLNSLMFSLDKKMDNERTISLMNNVIPTYVKGYIHLGII